MRRLALILVVLLAGGVGSAAAAPAPRIIGGSTTAPGDWSNVAAILGSGDTNARTSIVCAGTLIAPRVVLTAAHCVASAQPWSVQVAVGTRDLSAIGPDDRLSVAQVLINPAYVASTRASDVALLELDDPAVPAPMQIVSAAQAATLTPGAMLTVAGWGSTTPFDATSGAQQTTSYPDALQATQVGLIDDATCDASDTERSLNFDAAVMLCAGDPQSGGRDSCTGDSGGPLVAAFAGMRTLVGAVGFGVGCGQARFPGFYTRLANDAIQRWILATPAVTAPTILRVTNAGRRVTVTWSPPASSWAVDQTTVRIDGRTATVRGASATATVSDGGRIMVSAISVCGRCSAGGGTAAWAGRPTATARSTATARITGTVAVGRRLAAVVGRSDPWATVRYRWRVGGRPVRGAVGRTYRVRAADAGRRIQVDVRVRNAAGTRSVVATAARRPAA